MEERVGVRGAAISATKKPAKVHTLAGFFIAA